jgi:hypothetical protein
LQPLCLGHEPKIRVVTHPKRRDKIYINPIDPSIHVNGFNKEGYIFIDMEKEKNQNDLMESFGTTK